eukprot:Rhum_TRINITY_DN5033_c0_g1::Rhum_TRINITY_DN5033_c0_g1_i1::g.16309::m.16309
MHILLRRKLRVVHPLMTYYGLKLLNDLCPHMGRKWKVQNTKALSQLYRYLIPTIPDACSSIYASADTVDSSTELPVPAAQREAEEHMQKVSVEYSDLDYPSLRPYS